VAAKGAGRPLTDAREQILARIRRALRDVPAAERPEEVIVPRDYARSSPAPTERLLSLLCDRLREYGAECERTQPNSVAGAVADACRALGLRRLAIPPELPAAWRPEGVELLEDRDLGNDALAGVDAALTGCAVAIAQTGTLALDGRSVSGRRALTLLPDHHLCVVAAEQVVDGVPEAIARLRPAAVEHRSPVTLVSGPSATSDIELQRVAGVHGPRHLHVIIAAERPPGRGA